MIPFNWLQVCTARSDPVVATGTGAGVWEGVCGFVGNGVGTVVAGGGCSAFPEVQPVEMIQITIRTMADVVNHEVRDMIMIHQSGLLYPPELSPSCPEYLPCPQEDWR